MTQYEVTTTGQELTEILPGSIDPNDPTHFILETHAPALAEQAMNRDPAVIEYRELGSE